MNFRNWILQNFPLLEDDFDALTDYELFCKMLEYVKGFAEDNEEFKKQLETYENYFNNLDVQEEINNKLDEMASDGTLDQIIEQFINSSALWGFDTVAEMKNATNLINGSYAKTLGFYNLNDGGSATYKIRNVTNEDIVDNALIIAINNTNLVAELIVTDYINVKQIGVINNNSTNSSILNLFIANHSNYNLYFPKDYYYFEDPITMARGITVFGDFESNYGLANTYLTASLHFAKSGFINCDKNSFRNLSIYGSSISSTNGYNGIERRSPEGNACSIENCNISNFYAGVNGLNKSVLVNNCIINSCNIGILNVTDGRVINNTITLCYDGINNTDQGDMTITNNRIEWCDRYGIFLTRGRHYIISNNLLDRNGRQGMRCENVRLINIIGNYFRRNYASDASAANNHTHVILTDCIDINFNSNNGSSEYITDGDTTSDVTPYNGIYLFHNVNINLVGNNFANVVNNPYVFGNSYPNINIDDFTLGYTQAHGSLTSSSPTTNITMPIYYNMNDAQMPFGFKLIVSTRNTAVITSAKTEEFIIYQASEYLLNNVITSNGIQFTLTLDRENGNITATATAVETGGYAITLKIKPITFPETSNYKFYSHL